MGSSPRPLCPKLKTLKDCSKLKNSIVIVIPAMDDPAQRCEVLRPCPLHSSTHHHFLCPQHHHLHRHNHHHHHYLSPNCQLHGFLLQPNSHQPTCPLFASPFLPQNPQPPSAINLDLQAPPEHKETFFSDTLFMQEQNEELEEDEDEDPVFVLTDEWREFFAKSEAKRKLAKRKAKKKGKKKVVDSQSHVDGFAQASNELEGR